MPREGHKFSSWSIRSLSTHFNPHTPRGARQRDVDFGVIPKTFQSTCPARGTTISSTVFEPLPLDFNPRAPRGARPAQHLPHPFVVSISIHVPREGHDHPVSPSAQPISAFQSTCPARGTTFVHDCALVRCAISIHVPREGHDGGLSPHVKRCRLFQSTCPARGTTMYTPTWDMSCIFQSTCPARGTTIAAQRRNQAALISIHVPREGHDSRHKSLLTIISGFQSTCPARGTTKF